MRKIYALALQRPFSAVRGFLLAALLLAAWNVGAQVSGYTYSQSSGAYTPITGGTQHWATPSGTGTVPDDNTINNVAIGFTFVYNGVNYTTVSIANNGYIMLGNGASTVTGTNYAGLNGGDNVIIAGAGSDLQLGWRTTGTRTSGSPTLTALVNTTGVNIGDNVQGTGIPAGATVVSKTATTVTMSANATSSSTAGTFTFGGEVRSQLLGVPGSQTFVIQYDRERRFGTTGANEMLTFQIRLNETTNTIDVVYGNCFYNATAGTTTVGLRGSTNADFNSRRTSSPHDWNNTTATAAISETVTFSGAGNTAPVSGLTMTWTPPPPVCVTTPVGGTVSGPATLTLGQVGTFTVTGNAANIQWQSSPDDIVWTDIAGATAASQGLFSGVPGVLYLRNRANGAYCTDDPSPSIMVTVLDQGNNTCSPAPLAFGTNGPYNTSAWNTQTGEVAPPTGGCSLAGNWCSTTPVLFATGWFTFVAPASGRIIIQTPGFDTQLALWSVGNCSDFATFSLVAANDDDPDYVAHGGVIFSSYIAVDCPSLVPGQTYYVQVDPYSNTTHGTTTVILTDPGVIDSDFTGLPATICQPGGLVTLVPNVPGGTFSGPGVSGNTFDPIAAGNGSHTITYTRAAPHTCRSTSHIVQVGICGCTDTAGANYNPAATIDDGSCVYAPGENPAQAIAITPGIFGVTACNAVLVDLTTAAPSPAALTSAVTGEDRWYKFTAATSGARLRVDSFFDIFIELQDDYGNLVGSEHHPGTGVEILNIGGLTPGEVYRIGVRNYDSGLGNGVAELCVHTLRASQCDYGPGPYTLCQSFKAKYVNANEYIFNLTSQTTLNTYTKNNGTNTSVVLSSIPNLAWGDTYDVNIDVVYNLLDGQGNVEQVTVLSTSTCSLIVSAQPNSVLRTSDNCANHAPHLLANSIAAQQFICGAIDWHWVFTRTDVAELPIHYYKGSSNRFVKLSDVSGLTPGGTYDVTVAPVFSYGEGVAGPASCLQLAGLSMMVLNNENHIGQADITEKLVTEAVDAAIYPNPNNGEMIIFNLTGLGTDAEWVQVRVLDSFGKVVFANSLSALSSVSSVITFDSPLASGIYLVQVSAGSQLLVTERMVVQR